MNPATCNRLVQSRYSQCLQCPAVLCGSAMFYNWPTVHHSERIVGALTTHWKPRHCRHVARCDEFASASRRPLSSRHYKARAQANVARLRGIPVNLAGVISPGQLGILFWAGLAETRGGTLFR